ncbi:B12-binding domain-containing radical SAM protein [Acidiluteibacter ferrifornacis]|uniref:Radical SAM protein n=1 Tax=Acidiluteibacter ferrifornacis TaxID=2692424 RepID=A0A6N9NJL4_9FLAO|nr:radical SAM protein [Acidiluteibacter ferrifornacis]MBR9831773.1 B12-binding domain-containing radical SAM protein [bacterium]NBG66113.1 radical SAM protein [Acidiluteibacter ferrifornacis]
MSILLTHGYFLEEDETEQKIMRPYPPLGLLYISAYLEENGVGHELIDSTFSNQELWFNNVLSLKPKLIAIYTNLMTKVKILKLIKRVNNTPELSETKILLGGPDVTYNWENYLKYGADFLVIGEGEETFLEFSKQFFGQQDFSSVDGLAYKSATNEFIKNPPRTKIKEVDQLSMPNRKKIDLTKYLETWKKYHGKSTLNISTQRGCPYTCQWCSTAVYGQSYRRRSPKLVVDEIEYLIKNYNPDALWFVDDVFTVSHKWLEEFSREMQNRNLKIPFECITRAERMNEKVLVQLKAAGCFRIWIGAESGSQRIIDLMKRQVDINKVSDMMLLTQKFGMEAGTFIMVGYPTETKTDIELTIDYLKKANPNQFTITVAYPIKGTGLYTQIEKDIIVQPEWSTSTDRQIDFKRTFPRRYYDFAVRRIVNEVNYEKLKNADKHLTINAFIVKLKAFVSLIRMSFFQVG